MDTYRPQHLKSALQLLKAGKGRYFMIAGGTNMIPDLRAKAIRPKAFIDISRFKNLSYIKEEKKEIRIGALTTISKLADSNTIQLFALPLSQAAQQLGNPLVRNRATIGGNLADASPAADTAPPLLALEARVVMMREGAKERSVAIDQFFLGPNQTRLRRDEMIKEIIFSKMSPHAKTAYFKLGLRNSMAISIISIALLLEMEGTFCKKARIGLGAVAPFPMRAYRTEEMLTEEEVTERLLEACGQTVREEIDPISDIRASKEYRTEVVSVLLKRLIRQIAFQQPV